MKKGGYTLLETVVYISILAVICIMVVGSLLSIYQAFTKTRVERELVLNGDVAMETMVREIRAAANVDPSSIFGINPGELKMGSKKFSLSGTALQEQDGSGPAQALTTSDVSVTNLIFYATSSANSTLIKIQLALRAGSGIFLKTMNFYGSAVTRGAY